MARGWQIQQQRGHAGVTCQQGREASGERHAGRVHQLDSLSVVPPRDRRSDNSAAPTIVCRRRGGCLRGTSGSAGRYARRALERRSNSPAVRMRHAHPQHRPKRSYRSCLRTTHFARTVSGLASRSILGLPLLRGRYGVWIQPVRRSDLLLPLQLHKQQSGELTILA